MKRLKNKERMYEKPPVYYELSTESIVALLQGKELHLNLYGEERFIFKCKNADLVLTREEVQRLRLREDVKMLRVFHTLKEMPKNSRVIIVDKN